MSRRLRKSGRISGSGGLDAPPQEAAGERHKPASRRATDTASAHDATQTAYAVATELRPDPHSAQYILAMLHDLKKLAAKSGLQRVALILEMAELEALDQVRKPTP
mgnify:CR=1 FL=1